MIISKPDTATELFVGQAGSWLALWTQHTSDELPALDGFSSVPNRISELVGFGQIRIYQDAEKYYWFEPHDPLNEADVDTAMLAFSLYFAFNWGSKGKTVADTKRTLFRHPLIANPYDINNPCVTQVWSVLNAAGRLAGMKGIRALNQSTFTLNKCLEENKYRSENLPCFEQIVAQTTRLREVKDAQAELTAGQRHAWERIRVGDILFHHIDAKHPNERAKFGRYPHVATVVGWGERDFEWRTKAVTLYRTWADGHDKVLIPYVVDRGFRQDHLRGPRPFDDHKKTNNIPAYFTTEYEFAIWH